MSSCFSSDLSKIIPSKPAEIISPIPTVAIRYGNASRTPYAYINTNGTMTVFESMGGTGESHLNFRKKYVPSAPKSVARLPKIMSKSAPPTIMLESKQPTNSPGTAAGVKYGSTVSASDNLTCIAPLASPIALATNVSTTYSAAIIAA